MKSTCAVFFIIDGSLNSITTYSLLSGSLTLIGLGKFSIYFDFSYQNFLLYCFQINWSVSLVFGEVGMCQIYFPYCMMCVYIYRHLFNQNIFSIERCDKAFFLLDRKCIRNTHNIIYYLYLDIFLNEK